MKYLLLTLFLPLFLFFSLKPIFAVDSSMRSSSFRIDWPSVNMGAGLPSSDNYILNATLGQNAAGLYSSTGFLIRSGFQYINSIIPFYFSIEKTAIAFGILEIDTPKSITSKLTVQAGGADGYQVLVSEKTPLTSGSGNILADTRGDNGSCSETLADTWSQSSTYGFGFNITGDDVPSEFTGGKYKQFADLSHNEVAQAIMSKNGVTWNAPNNAWPWQSQATVTYKVNRGSTQAAGNYQNIITYTAIPSF